MVNIDKVIIEVKLVNLNDTQYSFKSNIYTFLISILTNLVILYNIMFILYHRDTQ